MSPRDPGETGASWSENRGMINEVSRRRQIRPPSDRLLLAMLLIVLAIIATRAGLRWWWK
jgi:hypothetical protein